MIEQATRFNFDDIAGDYDRWYETVEGARYDYLEKRGIRPLLPMPEGEEALLEVGCGTGWWSDFFAAAGYRVTGIDFSHRMIAQAQGKGIHRARFMVADAHRLPFPDRTFRVTAAITAVEFARDPQQIIAEMARCTRSGGTLLLGVLNRAARLNRERKARGAGPFAEVHLFTAAELSRLLARYGRPALVATAFPLSVALPNPWGEWVDTLFTWCRRRGGAFLVAGVTV